MKAISLFTGAGGLDLGFEAAGFETVVSVELDSDAIRTVRHNRPDWGLIDRDIHDIPTEELLAKGELSEGEADVLIGGPPCQPFSKSGYWAGGDAKRLDDPRATTLEAYLRVLAETKPRAFLLENVAGLAYQNKDEGLLLLRRTIESINESHDTNYSFSIQLLNAADFGVPQERERVFVIGHRDGRLFEFPRPTHARLDRGSAHDPTSGDSGPYQLKLGQESLLPPATAWDALGDIEETDDPTLKVTGKWAELLSAVPEGCNYLYHTDRGEGLPLFGWRRRYWSFLLKLAKRYPAWTITAKPGSAIGPFHWNSRRLSGRELARLQTFPDGYEVLGNLRAVQKQLGNAVPSGLAEILAREIRKQFLDGHEDSDPPTLIPRHRTDLPDPEPLTPVPKKYHHLIGTHDEHPGEGKGPGALERDGQVS